MTDLFILVGTNPLPCYVSAICLKNYYRECRLHLICSQDNKGIKQAGTFEIGKRIKQQLIKNKHFEEDDFAKPVEIKDVSSKTSIESALREILEGCENIHLNYTGGTKSMAAISYHLFKARTDEGIECSSSYLDGRRNMMIIDGEAAGDGKYDLRQDKALALDLETVSLLHDLRQTGEKIRSEEYDDILEKLITLLNENRLSQISFCKTDKKNTEKVIKNRNDLIASHGNDLNAIKKKHIEKYIDGVWLEHYIYIELQKQEAGFELYFDVSDRFNDEDHFQLDIVAIYGYQITLISITTNGSKGLCKLKAFEAIYRAQQLGGDEAKTIMVTLMKKPEALIDDLKKSYGSFVPGFTAFGIDDLRDKSIFESIKNHIEE